jgi:alanyl-tRNA synthetase
MLIFPTFHVPAVLKIVSESGIAAGVRRIEAVTGAGMYDLLVGRDRIVKALSISLKVQPEQLEARISSIYDEQRRLLAEVERLKVRGYSQRLPLLNDSHFPSPISQ